VNNRRSIEKLLFSGYYKKEKLKTKNEK